MEKNRVLCCMSIKCTVSFFFPSFLFLYIYIFWEVIPRVGRLNLTEVRCSAEIDTGRSVLLPQVNTSSMTESGVDYSWLNESHLMYLCVSRAYPHFAVQIYEVAFHLVSLLCNARPLHGAGSLQGRCHPTERLGIWVILTLQTPGLASATTLSA